MILKLSNPRWAPQEYGGYIYVIFFFLHQWLLKKLCVDSLSAIENQREDLHVI